MKRNQFIKELVKSGCYLKRHGSRHDISAFSTKVHNIATLSRRVRFKNAVYSFNHLQKMEQDLICSKSQKNGGKHFLVQM